MDQTNDSSQAWKKQAETLEYYKQTDPGKITRTESQNEADVFREIGIWNLPQAKPKGYIRLRPQDFIVEEKTAAGKILRINEIDPDAIQPDDSAEALPTIYATLTKIGIPTSVAVERLSVRLGIKREMIGFGGLKDSDAITSQLISLSRTGKTAADLSHADIPNVILSDFYCGKGSLMPGCLDSNIFTITIRTDEAIDPLSFSTKVDTINKFGILNYFQSQRFGGLRLLSHTLGMLVARGDYENAIKTFLTEPNPYDIPLISDLRKQASAAYPDMRELESIYSPMPYTFANELRLIRFLKINPENSIGGLIEIKDQTTLWAYAYTSLLFNKHLSDYSGKRGCVKETFPLAFSSDRSDVEVYKEYLEADGTKEFWRHLKPFRFIQIKSRRLPGRIFPVIHAFKSCTGGAVLEFTLPKGSYATTLLTNLFELYQGLPLPDWVDKVEHDPKQILGRGSIARLKRLFKDSWYSKLDDL